MNCQIFPNASNCFIIYRFQNISLKTKKQKRTLKHRMTKKKSKNKINKFRGTYLPAMAVQTSQTAKQIPKLNKNKLKILNKVHLARILVQFQEKTIKVQQIVTKTKITKRTLMVIKSTQKMIKKLQVLTLISQIEKLSQ